MTIECGALMSYIHSRVVRITVTFKVKGLTIVISLHIKVHILLLFLAHARHLYDLLHAYTFMGMIWIFRVECVSSGRVYLAILIGIDLRLFRKV